MKNPSIQIEINLVPHGYQIDAYDFNNVQDEEAKEIKNKGKCLYSMECRDFDGSYDVNKMAMVIVAKMFKVLRGMEQEYLSIEKEVDKVFQKYKSLT